MHYSFHEEKKIVRGLMSLFVFSINHEGKNFVFYIILNPLQALNMTWERFFFIIIIVSQNFPVNREATVNHVSK